jgi:hypothetical protein
MTDQVTSAIFPIIELSSERLTAALNNLHSRLEVLEKREGVDAVLSASDRAILAEAGNFFGVHAIVANTIASKEAGIENIDPNTGLEKVELRKPVFQNVAIAQTGS